MMRRNERSSKRIVALILPLCLILLAGCNVLGLSDDDETEEDEPENEYSFKVNGEEWPAVSAEAEKMTRAVFPFENYFGITFSQEELAEIYYIQNFSLRVPFEGEGTYSLDTYEGEDPSGSLLYYGGIIVGSDYDVTISYHDPIPDSTNKVTITQYDEARKVVEGTWQGSFARRDYERDEFEHLYRLPDTVHVTDGEFKLYCEDYRD